MMKKVIGRLRKKSSDQKTVSSKLRKRVFTKISPEELNSLIAKKAYSLYENRGYAHGDDLRDWYEAEKAVMASLRK